jgi:hypothetical protein
MSDRNALTLLEQGSRAGCRLNYGLMPFLGGMNYANVYAKV